MLSHSSSVRILSLLLLSLFFSLLLYFHFYPNVEKKSKDMQTNLITITNTGESVAPNFIMSEFFTKDLSYTKPSHKLDGRLIDAAQYLRTNFDVPIRVQSSYRSKAYNLLKGGAPNSTHVTYQAIDLKFLERSDSILDTIQLDIETEGPLFQYLINNFGIIGFGVYNWGIHIDTGVRPHTNIYNGTKYRFWNNRGGLKNQITDIQEDGLPLSVFAGAAAIAIGLYYSK